MNSYPAFIITGCDTNVGKTLVSALLMKFLKGTYWKPIQSGSLHDSDRKSVAHLSGLPPTHFLPEVYSLEQPLSPHQAAKMDGISIDPHRIVLPPSGQIVHKPLILEGAGGVLVPITDHYLMIDLFVDLSLPVVVVGRNKLGVINHMLMTLEVLRSRHIQVIGFITSGGDGHPDNVETIARMSGVPNLGVIPEIPDLENGLSDMLLESIDGEALMRSIGAKHG